MKKKLLYILLAVLFVVPTGIYIGLNKDTLPFTKLTEESQQSLLDIQDNLTKNTMKSKYILKELSTRYSKLSEVNKRRASVIAYNAVKNTNVYYNSLMYVMGGEIAANNLTDDLNSLNSVKNSKYIKGFVEDAEEQGLKGYNLNKDIILYLPDFKQFSNWKTDDELGNLIKLGSAIQDLTIFTDTYVNVEQAAFAHDLAIQMYQLNEETGKTTYQEDYLSIAKLMSEVIFGTVQTNNYTIKGEKVFLTKDYYQSMKKLSESDVSLAEEIKEWLSYVDEGTLTMDYGRISDKGVEIVKNYGTSVYWTSGIDMRHFYEFNGEQLELTE